MITSDEAFWSSLRELRTSYTEFSQFCETCMKKQKSNPNHTCASTTALIQDTPLQGYTKVYNLCCYGYVRDAGNSIEVVYDTILETYALWLCSFLSENESGSSNSSMFLFPEMSRVVSLVLRGSQFRFMFLEQALADDLLKPARTISLHESLQHTTREVVFGDPKTFWSNYFEGCVTKILCSNIEDCRAVMDNVKPVVDLMRECKMCFEGEYVAGLESTLTQTLSPMWREVRIRGSCLTTLHKVLEWYMSEKERYTNYFSHVLATDVLDRIYIDAAMKPFVAEYFRYEKTTNGEHVAHLITQERWSDVGIVYQICVCHDSLQALFLPNLVNNIVQCFEEALGRQQGLNLADAFETYESVVRLYTTYEHYRNVIGNDVLKGDTLYASKLRQSLHTFVNERTEKVCYSLVQYFHFRSEDVEFNEKLVRAILTCVSDLDVFTNIYRICSAHKVLSAVVMTDTFTEVEESERSSMQCLSSILGLNNVKSITAMVDDVLKSKQENESLFENVSDDDPQRNSVMRVTSLCSGKWPSRLNAMNTFHVSKEAFHLAPELESHVTAYERLYTTKFPNRKLKWLHHAGMVDVVSSCYKITVVCDAGVASLLLLFNDQDEIPTEVLDTQITQRAARYKLITSNSTKTTTILHETTFRLDQKRRLKMKVAYDPMGKSQLWGELSGLGADGDEVSARRALEQQRLMAVEATIVRVMKGMKVTTFGTLTTEIQRGGIIMSLFVPSQDLIKKCVGRLMERGFLGLNERQAGELQGEGMTAGTQLVYIP